MTTSWKAMKEELMKHQPDHLPHSWWESHPKIMEETVQHAVKNNLPIPIGVSRRSLGVPRYKNSW